MIKVNRVKQVIPVLTLLALSACGGGSSGSGTSADTASPEDATDEFGLGPTAPDIQEVIDTIEVEQFTGSDGITFVITQYFLQESIFAGFRMRVDNNSTRSIESVGCEIQMFKEGEQVNSASPSFIPTTIDPGESAIGSDHTNFADTTFSDFDRILVRLCTWDSFGEEFDLRRDITTGPVTVDFLGYSSAPSGRPQARLLLTNNSADTVSRARCDLDAKVGRTIVTVGSTTFDDAGDIAAGEAEESALILLVDSLDNYDSEPFDLSNLNCTYAD